MTRKVTAAEQTLFSNEKARLGVLAPRPVVPEELDYTPIVDLIGTSPDTLADALARITTGSMTYKDFETLRGGEFEYEEDDEISEDFDENEFYEVENDSGKYYDKDKESRILAAESKKQGKNTEIQQETQGDVDKSDDKGDKE